MKLDHENKLMLQSKNLTHAKEKKMKDDPYKKSTVDAGLKEINETELRVL